MRKLLKIVGIVAVVLVTLVGLIILYIFLKYPDVGKPTNLSVEATPARLARGQYLATHVAICITCHSQRNTALWSEPTVPTTEGMGGYLLDEQEEVPGVVVAKNITPAGIGTMTDGELFRAITSGVRKNGEAMFPVMPYPAFNKMSDEDLYSIIAYIRTLRPIENDVPDHQLDFPLNFIVKMMPAPHVTIQPPDTSYQYEYGQYLVNAAGCIDCHSQKVRGEPIKGLEFAGGFEFRYPWGTVRSANITPDVESGIGSWTADDFVGRFEQYAMADSSTLAALAAEYNSPMPWVAFSGMSERDLTDIYKYLRTVPPVKNQVEKFTPAKK